VIGVVTVTYNSADVLPDFIGSLLAQSSPFRLYAVDNASADDSVDVIRRYDDARFVVLRQSENRGIAVGNNVGIDRALVDGCDWVLLLNNDTVFESDLLMRLVETAIDHDAGIVVPSIRYFDDPEDVWFESARFDRWRGSVPVECPPRLPPDAVLIECASTCCALVRPEIFAAVGLMDERYFVYWDDTDFFYRADQAGVRILLDPRIRILHKVSSLTGGGESEFSQVERTKNRVIFIRKHHRRVTRWIGLTLTGVNAARLAVGGPSRRTRGTALAKAVIEGLRVPMP
jgi:GT2 family glycosyltransferase